MIRAGSVVSVANHKVIEFHRVLLFLPHRTTPLCTSVHRGFPPSFVVLPIPTVVLMPSSALEGLRLPAHSRGPARYCGAYGAYGTCNTRARACAAASSRTLSRWPATAGLAR
eukprot:SAG11_NODE_20425_length_445_cov_1.031792_1_plen_111_part_01